ncbi:PREDICTED: RH-like protein [Nanorana parkeri]|uniref:RH-like protein n=1 Tax=Nanorana parkeri TaxID=125878 RepID=UPI0008545DA6|nr:PREDICTED: RH-like protein [Nanorana parkeri]
MPPRYSASLRGLLTWMFLLLQSIFILVFLFFFSHGYILEGNLDRYPAFQDVNVIVILGVGFLFVFLRKYGFSGVAFNFLMTAVGLQWAIILDAFLFNKDGVVPTIGMTSLTTGLMSIFPVLISSGVILGKVNPLQLIIMTIIELPIFVANRYIMTKYLMMNDHISMMYAHIFGAYFGMAVSWPLVPPLPGNEASKQYEIPETLSELFSMLGALFMWMFWPSYNSVLLKDHMQKQHAIFNTYFTLAVSTVVVFAASALFNRKGKFKMMQVRNAMLAGGVAVGFSAHMVQYPWITMTIGLLAGLISTAGLTCMQDTLRIVTIVHDTCGVNYTFGVPGLLGALAYALIILVADYGLFGFPIYQALVGVGCILLTLTLSLVGGLLTGFLLKCKLLKPPKEWHYFHDQPYWEFAHVEYHL